MRLTWDSPGERFYESGVDQGVLYLPSTAGVPWSGLISVSENPTGGEAKPYYLDGLKYLNIASAEEFEATITAFNSPPEFAVCDGYAPIHRGLLVTHQRRTSFGFTYRVKVGNDTVGEDFGYKIHIVYNALAEPSERTNESSAEIVKPSTFSWKISTLPPDVTGYKPTAHYVIDSRSTPAGLLMKIEDILYGNDSAEARLPYASELVEIFNDPGPTIAWNLARNPAFRKDAAFWTPNTTYGGLTRVTPPVLPLNSSILTAGKYLCTTDIPASTAFASTVTYQPRSAGTYPAAVVDLLRDVSKGVNVELMFYCYDSASVYLGSTGVVTRAVQDYWTTLSLPGIAVPTGTTQIRLGLRSSGTSFNAGDALYFTAVRYDTVKAIGEHLPDYFDGSTPNTPDLTHLWFGTPDASESTRNSWT